MVRYFFSSLNVLNGLLGLAVAAVLNFAVIPLLDPVARISLPSVKETVTPPGEQRTLSMPVTDYAVISNKNLFHPERRIPPEKQQEKAVPKPDVALYGTLIADDASLAFIEDKRAPYSTPGRGKRQTTLKKGDHLSGYIVSEIAVDRIVLIKGDEKVVVMLDDKGKKRADESPAAPATGRPVAGGVTHSSPTAPSSPQTMPSLLPAVPSSPQAITSPAPAAVSSGPGIAGPPPRSSAQPSTSSSPATTPPSAQDAAVHKPGIGGSGTWPPTKSSMEQTQKKRQEAWEIRARQVQPAQ